MLKNIRLCLLISIISLHLSLPSLAMNNDQDQEVRNRITKKIAKYEIKINDLRRLLENFHINETPIPTTPPREVDIDPLVPTTPPHNPPQILHLVAPQEITQDQIRTSLREMYDSGNYTYATLGELLGYEPDKTESTPNGKSTGKAAVKRIFDGTPSPGLCDKFRERVRNGTIPFPTVATPTTRRTTPTMSPATPITLPRAATSTMRETTFVTPPPIQYAVGGQPYDEYNDELLGNHDGFYEGPDEDYSSDEANPYHND